MTSAIKIIGLAGVQISEQAPPTGYIKDVDLEAVGGQGIVTVTESIDEAMHFPGWPEAMAYWRQRPASRPTRADGQPNRPLTAYTVEIVQVPE